MPASVPDMITQDLVQATLLHPRCTLCITRNKALAFDIELFDETNRRIAACPVDALPMGPHADQLHALLHFLMRGMKYFKLNTVDNALVRDSIQLWHEPDVHRTCLPPNKEGVAPTLKSILAMYKLDDRARTAECLVETYAVNVVNNMPVVIGLVKQTMQVPFSSLESIAPGSVEAGRTLLELGCDPREVASLALAFQSVDTAHINVCLPNTAVLP